MRGEQDPLPVEVHVRTRCLVVSPCLPGRRRRVRDREVGAVRASYLCAVLLQLLLLLLLCCACPRQPRRFHVRCAADCPDRRQLQAAIRLPAQGY